MKISELPEPYKSLAEMRREQAGNTGDELANSNETFIWAFTLEGGLFWSKLNDGYTPDIPASSLAELEAWKKSKDVKSAKPDYKELPSEPTVCSGAAKREREFLLTTAQMAMQGLIASGKASTYSTIYSLSDHTFTYASAMLQEAKKRGLI